MCGVVLAALASCSGESNGAIGTTTRATETETTTAVETTPARTTTTPVTTRPTTTPPTSAVPATTTTTIAPVPSSTEAPQPADTVPLFQAPTWPAYEPLPGVPGVAALTNASRPELENVPALAVKVDNHPDLGDERGDPVGRLHAQPR